MLRKIFLFVIVYTLSINTYSEESDVLMRMYERLEMIRIQMQQLTEENQQLNNKISNLQDQQDRLYQDLAKKIQLLQNNLGKNKKTDSKLIIPKKKNTEKKIDDSLSENKKIVSSTEKENLAFIKENPNKETEKKKLVDILPEEENELDLAKKYTKDMLKYENATLRIEGHADERGSRAYNLALGEKRAETIKEMMLINGVSSSSIEVVSYGEENPSVLGTNEETHSLNRRVEIVFSNTGK